MGLSKFSKLEGKLSHEKGVNDPAGLAAAIGRKKYGKKEFQHKASEGRKKHKSMSEVFVIPEVKLWQLTVDRKPNPNLVKGAWAASQSLQAQTILGDHIDLAQYRIAYFANKHGIELNGIDASEFAKALPVHEPDYRLPPEKRRHFFFDQNDLHYGRQ